jgi:hypothetical protein
LSETLRKSKPGRLEVLKNAYEKGITNDLRLFRLYSKGIDSRDYEVADFIFEKIIPSIGKPMTAYLLEDFDPDGDTEDSRRLSLLHSLGYKNAPALAARALAESPSIAMKVAAIDILKDDSKNEELLLSLTSGKRSEIHEAALLALMRVNPEKCKKPFWEALKSDKYGVALKAAKACEDPELKKEIAEYLKAKKIKPSTVQRSRYMASNKLALERPH